MQPILVHDKQRLLAFFQRNSPLHVYSIGDLDDFYWPYTTWYALEEDGELAACALVYTRSSLPVLLALGDDSVPLVRLLERTRPFLPRRLYAHLTPGAEEGFQESYRITSHGKHLKMALADPSKLDSIDPGRAVPLGIGDVPQLLELYDDSYPGHWFEPEMLRPGLYFGVREGPALVAAAGVHVYSLERRVAALGNIATRPEYRGRGLARCVTARLCRSLLASADTLGLNVHADNVAAIACYRNLGFATVAEYHEVMLEATG